MNIDAGDVSPMLQELIIQAERLSNDDLQKLIAQTRALVDLSNQKNSLR